jgi:hypothetical protein
MLEADVTLTGVSGCGARPGRTKNTCAELSKPVPISPRLNWPLPKTFDVTESDDKEGVVVPVARVRKAKVENDVSALRTINCPSRKIALLPGTVPVIRLGLCTVHGNVTSANRDAAARCGDPSFSFSGVTGITYSTSQVVVPGIKPEPRMVTLVEPLTVVQLGPTVLIVCAGSRVAVRKPSSKKLLDNRMATVAPYCARLRRPAQSGFPRQSTTRPPDPLARQTGRPPGCELLRNGRHLR